MRRVLLSILLLLLVLPALGQTINPPPSLINFQGRLAKPDGTPVADGSTYALTLSLWDTATAGTGTKRWQQSFSNITVHNGVFAVLLDLTAGYTTGELSAVCISGKEYAMIFRSCQQRLLLPFALVPLLNVTALPAQEPHTAQVHAAQPSRKSLPLPWNYSVKGMEARLQELKAAARKAEARRDATARDERAEPKADVKARSKPQKEEEAGTDWLEAYLYYFRQRAYPNDTINWSAWPAAMVHRDKMKPATAAIPSATAGLLRTNALASSPSSPKSLASTLAAVSCIERAAVRA